MKYILFFVSLFFPERCTGCGISGTWLCEICEKKILKNAYQVCPISLKKSEQGKVLVEHTGIDNLMVISPYRDNTILQKLIHNLKYKFAFDIAKKLGGELENFLQDQQLNQDLVITSVPLHWKRIAARGFNQSELLARELGQTQKLLKRVKHTQKQAQLSKQERKNNLKNAFEFCGENIPKNVLLVDDVASTCSTLNECAQVLKVAGVEKVFAVVLARNI